MMKFFLTLVLSLLFYSTRGFVPSSRVLTRRLASPSSSPSSHLSMADSSRQQVIERETSVVVETKESPLDISVVTEDGDEANFDAEYKKGIAIIGFITLLNASLAPVWHTVFATGNGPPPLFLNAVVSVVALIGLLAGGPLLDSKVESTSALADAAEEKWSFKSFRGGIELGFWKGLGTTCHM